VRAFNIQTNGVVTDFRRLLGKLAFAPKPWRSMVSAWA
jgi:hypothetical protein